jgi:hypothetical protein
MQILMLPPASPALAPFVESLWHFTSDWTHRRERILPTGTMQLLVNLHEDEMRTYAVGGAEPQQRMRGAVISGAYARAFGIDTDEQRHVVGVAFRPGGAAPFFREPCDALREDHIELDRVWGRDGAVLRERLLEAKSPEALLRRLEAVLLERLARPLEVDKLVEFAISALDRGAPVDLLFQSVAGTAAGNRAFGVDLALLDDADAAIREHGRLPSPTRWYFETGQGSELSSAAHAGIDQMTLEARCYGVARRYRPLLVNSVVGFIGPEYLWDARQVIRAGLEDHFMGKLLGVPMGVDVCYTNHMAADQNDLENLAVLLAAAGCNYVMAVPMGDDCMLSYQTSSFHDAAALRELLDRRPAPELEAWLEARGLMEHGRLTKRAGDARALA